MPHGGVLALQGGEDVKHHAIARGFSASLAIARSNPEKQLLRKILKRKNAGLMRKLNN